MYLVLKVGFYFIFFKALNTRLLQQPKTVKRLATGLGTKWLTLPSLY